MTDKKTNIPGIYKSVENGALLNKDLASLEQYKKRKKQANMIKEMEKDISELKSNVEEIKDLIRSLIDKCQYT